MASALTHDDQDVPGALSALASVGAVHLRLYRGVADQARSSQPVRLRFASYGERRILQVKPNLTVFSSIPRSMTDPTYIGILIQSTDDLLRLISFP